MRTTSKYASPDADHQDPDRRTRSVGSLDADEVDADPHTDLVEIEVAACRLLAFRDDCSDAEILQDCHRRLLTGGLVTWPEADRIVAAIALRLGYAAPQWAPPPR